MLPFFASAQCFQLIDQNGNANNNPTYVSCGTAAFTLILQTNQAIGAYTVNWGDGSPNTTGAGLTPPAFISHTYPTGVSNYNLTFTETATGCVVNALVVIEEAVNAAIQIPLGGVTQICAPNDMRFINASTNVSSNTTFRWDFGDGSPILNFNSTNGGDTVSHTYQRNTVNCVTTVTLTAENFCSFGTPTVASFNPIQIYDIDDAQITASATDLCYPDTVVTFQNTTAKNCVPQGNTSQRYEYWNFGNHWGTGDSIVDWQPFDPPARPGYTIAFPGKGTYTVMMADSNRCGRDTAYQVIVIGDPPVADFNLSDDTVCAGEQFQAFNVSSGGANAFAWNFGDGTGWQVTGGGTRNKTYNIPGTYTITLAVSKVGGSPSCLDTIAKTIEVLVSPDANFSINPASGCDSFLVSFTNTSVNGAQYLWDFDDGTTSNAQNPGNHFYNAVGTYNPSLLVTALNGCQDTEQSTVDVYSTPIVNFNPKNVCQNATATFVDSSYTTDGNPLTTWSWNFGDGTTSTQQNPNHLYTANGNYTVTLVASTAFCTGSDTFVISVEPKPTALFSMSDSAGCAPLSVNFTNNSLVGTSYTWLFGDGNTSTQSDPTHSFSNNDTTDTSFVVTLITETAFGCADTITDTVTVFPVPQAAFSSNATPDCGPLQVSFTNSSTGATSYTWDFGDTTGSNLTNPSHTYDNKTLFIEIYETKLIATNSRGCTDTAIQNITVYPEPIFGFSTNPDSGCSPLQVTMPSVIGAVSYAWDFDDGTTATGPTPTHIFTNGTTNNVRYNVRLVATSSFGCSDTTFQTVVVHPNPEAIFSLSDSINCQPLDLIITNSSTGGSFFDWNFGNGDTDTTSASVFSYQYTHTNSQPEVNDLRLIVETDRGCKDTLIKQVTVYPDVIAEFSKSDTAGCSPLIVSFNDLSVNAQNFNWSFGDGNSSTAQNPRNTYYNTLNTNLNRGITMIASSTYGCADTIVDSLVIYPLPNAIFSVNDTIGCQPLDIQITNSSAGAIRYFWDFGNGDTSMAPGNLNYSYTHNLVTPQNYSMRLIAETDFNCRDTMARNIVVYPPIGAGFIASDTLGCNPVRVNFSDTSFGAQFYDWDFDNGNTSVAATVSEVFRNTSRSNVRYNPRLIVRSVYGCRDTAETEILIYPDPVSRFTPNSTAACQPFNLQVQNTSILASQSFWDFGDGDTSMSNAVSLTHRYPNPTNSSLFYDLQLIVETVNGCRDTSVQQIEVYPLVEAKYSQSDTAGCHILDVDFVDQSTNVQAYSWNFGDGGTDVVSSPSHSFQNTTTSNVTYNVNLVVTSPQGCRDTASSTVTVYPQPVAAFTATPVTQKFPSATVTLTNNSNVGNWNYLWDFDNMDTSGAENPGAYTYGTWGEFDIVLYVFSENCADTATQRIVIEPPRAVVNFSGSGEGCRPLTIDFENNTQYGVDFTWNFGDGGTSKQEFPAPYTYFNAGTYSVSLTVVGPDGVPVTENKIDSVIVRPEAIALFDVAPDEVIVPTQPINLYNLSRDASIYLWDFGDSTTSTEESPEHFYQEKGIYTITLYADNEWGCADTFSVEDAVFADSKGFVDFPNAFIPDPSGPNGGRYNRNSFRNDIFFPQFEGVIQYQLMIFNRWGELVFESKDIGIGWDGYHQITGELLQQDVYVWRAVVKFANQQETELAGEVTLLR